jgi:hypothetical protein
MLGNLPARLHRNKPTRRIREDASRSFSLVWLASIFRLTNAPKDGTERLNHTDPLLDTLRREP